jgi:hypothetical protein
MGALRPNSQISHQTPNVNTEHCKGTQKAGTSTYSTVSRESILQSSSALGKYYHFVLNTLEEQAISFKISFTSKILLNFCFTKIFFDYCKTAPDTLKS